MRKLIGLFVVVGAVVAAVECGGGSSSPPPTTPPPTVAPPDAGTATITIVSGFKYSPSELTVAAGTQITVTNADSSSPHSVTSEASDNAFVPGSVAGVTFDTGVLNAPGPGGNGPYGPTPGGPGGSAVISIPAGTPSGTVIPFYCTVHKGMMVPANGHITVK